MHALYRPEGGENRDGSGAKQEIEDKEIRRIRKSDYHSRSPLEICPLRKRVNKSSKNQ